MAESPFTQIKKSVADNPAAGRLKEELTDFLAARAQHAVSSLGHKLGETASRLGEPGQGGGPSAWKSLSKGGQALAEGKSPAKAALTAGASHAKDVVADKVKGLFGKGSKSGGGKSKSVLISEDIDVGVPVREAYDQWTQFQEFSTFAKGVVSVEKSDDTSSNWKVKVAKSTRSWKASVTEQIPDERISWTTEGAKGAVKGVVTFHRVTDNLTRVLLVLEYFPKGLFEKTGNIWRAQGRRARLDLKLYRKFIMMRGEATDGWRGEIRDGEVVVDHDQAVEDEENADRSDSESGDAEYADGDSEDGYDDGDYAYEDGDDADYEDAEEDDDFEAYAEDAEDAEDTDDTDEAHGYAEDGYEQDGAFDEQEAHEEDQEEAVAPAPRRRAAPARR
ncbi:SRPBCC family protein [Streptomyces sp. NBC_01185]|uniref:SRPBCC family protein n=1 Tax=Streptomyces sp. NBC_01185 TaxID=2903764 RepID=UPI0038640FF2|nr:SRPBCC family protein [Streptomyces sp. NBC_01185]